MAQFNPLQVIAFNENHPRECAQMFHSGAANAPNIEEQSMHKEDAVLSGWVYMCTTALGAMF